MEGVVRHGMSPECRVSTEHPTHCAPSMPPRREDNPRGEVHLLPIVVLPNGRMHLLDDLRVAFWRERLEEPAKRWPRKRAGRLPTGRDWPREHPGNRAGFFLHLCEACGAQGRGERPRLCKDERV